MRNASISKVLAAVLSLSPAVAHASEVFYFCHDDSGIPENLKIDVARKHVSLVSGRSPSRCDVEFQDGAYAPLFTALPGQICIIGAMSQGEKVRFFVRQSGSIVTFGSSGSGGTQQLSLDTSTGVLESSAGTDECHRANG